jgi:hypothetical protein
MAMDTMDVQKKIPVEIARNFSRFSHRSGRLWTSLNVFGWWAVGDSDCPSDLDTHKT